MSRLSNTRTGSKAYSKGYLRSPAWHARRRKWFEDFEAQSGVEAFCYSCERTKAHTPNKSLDLHHVSYDGVTGPPEVPRWTANEKHEDLVPMCRDCHRDLHRRMDRGKDYYGWSRERATFTIIARQRQRLGMAG